MAAFGIYYLNCAYVSGTTTAGACAFYPAYFLTREQYYPPTFYHNIRWASAEHGSDNSHIIIHAYRGGFIDIIY